MSKKKWKSLGNGFAGYTRKLGNKIDSYSGTPKEHCHAWSGHGSNTEGKTVSGVVHRGHCEACSDTGYTAGDENGSQG